MPPGQPGRKTAPHGMPEPKTYYPTMEEFKDFRGFMERIEREDQAHLAGICKIVPPDEWIPRRAGYGIETFDGLMIEKPTKQVFKNITSSSHKYGGYLSKGIHQTKMSVADYYKMTQDIRYATPQHEDYDDLEKKYWKGLNSGHPVYGCDVATAITDDDQEVWNIARLDSILNMVAEELDVVLEGVNTAYVYFGMWKATFSWHTEDMDLYSINFVHHGAPKTWYCVPPEHGHLLEKACRDLFPMNATWCNNFMRHKACLVAPKILDQYGVPYQKMIQGEKEIIIVFPYAYHSGWNHGFNIAESTNFALERWVEYGKRASHCDCGRMPVTFKVDEFVKKFQPEKYDDWMAGRDIGPHPEDPLDVRQAIQLRIDNPEDYERKIEEKAEKEREKQAKKLKRYKEQQDKQKAINANIKWDVYKHKDFKEVDLEIDPDTFKPRKNKVGIQNKLGDIDAEAIKEMIGQGKLYKHAKRKLEDDDINDTQIVTEEKIVDMYKHISLADVYYTADPITNEPIMPFSSKMEEFMKTTDGMDLNSLNTIGVFTKIGDCIMMVQRLESNTHVSKKIKLDDSENKILQTDMYMKKDSGKIINVHPNTFLTMENQNLGEDLKGQSIKDLIDQGVLVKVGSKSEAAEAIKEKDIKVENKKEEEEEYQEELKKLDDPQDKISTKNAFDDEKVVTLDDDDDDDNDGGRDELLDEDDDVAFTSDESSESNDESSDDPDYFGTRKISEWKSTSNRAAKKKRKLLKRKLRDEMRAKRGYKGGSGRGRKPGKSGMAIKDEAKLCFEATKKMLDLEVLSVGSTFSISNLSERQVGPRACIVYVMRVLRGLKLLSQIKSEEIGDTQYKWRGLDTDDLKAQIRRIFEKDETSEDVVWNITRDMIKTFASSRKNIRTFLPMIAKLYDVDESRRILKVAGILEGLGLVETVEDDRGGLMYRGPDVYNDFCKELLSKYAATRPEISNSMLIELKLLPVEIKLEYVYEIEPPQFEKKEIVESTEVTEAEKQIAERNKDRVCTCGYTRELDEKVEINREGGRVYFKSKALVGGKRKKRCGKCTGCTAKKCNKCNHCLKKHLKKPCELRVCLYPQVPDCPCFR